MGEAGICTFLFVIWMTDAAVLYAFTIGAEHLPYDLPWLISMQRHVVAFELWGSLKGSVPAFIIFSVSAFSVPLLHEGRASLVQAVHARVRTVLCNPLPAVAWGLLLAVAMVFSIVLLPLLTVVLPVLA